MRTRGKHRGGTGSGPDTTLVWNVEVTALNKTTAEKLLRQLSKKYTFVHMTRFIK